MSILLLGRCHYGFLDDESSSLDPMYFFAGLPFGCFARFSAFWWNGFLKVPFRIHLNLKISLGLLRVAFIYGSFGFTLGFLGVVIRVY